MFSQSMNAPSNLELHAEDDDDQEIINILTRIKINGKQELPKFVSSLIAQPMPTFRLVMQNALANESSYSSAESEDSPHKKRKVHNKKTA